MDLAPSPRELKVFAMPFADLYPLYQKKITAKGRTEHELREVLIWLTGFDETTLDEHLEGRTSLENFFSAAEINPNAIRITGSICGVKIEEIQNSLMKKIRYMDKLVDELAKGRPMSKILRTQT